MWYYGTILYFGNYYQKDPRERAGLAANAIAVSGSPENLSYSLISFHILISIFATITAGSNIYRSCADHCGCYSLIVLSITKFCFFAKINEEKAHVTNFCR